MAPMRAFSFEQKWPTFDPRNGLHWTVKKYLTKHSFSFLKFIIFVDLERKNEFNGSIANYRSYRTSRTLTMFHTNCMWRGPVCVTLTSVFTLAYNSYFSYSWKLPALCRFEILIFQLFELGKLHQKRHVFLREDSLLASEAENWASNWQSMKPFCLSK